LLVLLRLISVLADIRADRRGLSVDSRQKNRTADRQPQRNQNPLQQPFSRHVHIRCGSDEKFFRSLSTLFCCCDFLQATCCKSTWQLALSTLAFGLKKSTVWSIGLLVIGLSVPLIWFAVLLVCGPAGLSVKRRWRDGRSNDRKTYRPNDQMPSAKRQMPFAMEPSLPPIVDFR